MHRSTWQRMQKFPFCHGSGQCPCRRAKSFCQEIVLPKRPLMFVAPPSPFVLPNLIFNSANEICADSQSGSQCEEIPGGVYHNANVARNKNLLNHQIYKTQSQNQRGFIDLNFLLTADVVSNFTFDSWVLFLEGAFTASYAVLKCEIWWSHSEGVSKIRFFVKNFSTNLSTSCWSYTGSH